MLLSRLIRQLTQLGPDLLHFAAAWLCNLEPLISDGCHCGIINMGVPEIVMMTRAMNQQLGQWMVRLSLGPHPQPFFAMR